MSFLELSEKPGHGQSEKDLKILLDRSRDKTCRPLGEESGHRKAVIFRDWQVNTGLLLIDLHYPL